MANYLHANLSPTRSSIRKSRKEMYDDEEDRKRRKSKIRESVSKTMEMSHEEITAAAAAATPASPSRTPTKTKKKPKTLNLDETTSSSATSSISKTSRTRSLSLSDSPTGSQSLSKKSSSVMSSPKSNTKSTPASPSMTPKSMGKNILRIKLSRHNSKTSDDDDNSSEVAATVDPVSPSKRAGSKSIHRSSKSTKSSTPKSKKKSPKKTPKGTAKKSRSKSQSPTKSSSSISSKKKKNSVHNDDLVDPTSLVTPKRKGGKKSSNAVPASAPTTIGSRLANISLEFPPAPPFLLGDAMLEDESIMSASVSKNTKKKGGKTKSISTFSASSITTAMSEKSELNSGQSLDVVDLYVLQESDRQKEEMKSIQDSLIAAEMEKMKAVDDATKAKRELRETRLELQRSQTDLRELRLKIQGQTETIDSQLEQIAALERAVECQLDRVEELEADLMTKNDEISYLEARLMAQSGIDLKNIEQQLQHMEAEIETSGSLNDKVSAREELKAVIAQLQTGPPRRAETEIEWLMNRVDEQTAGGYNYPKRPYEKSPPGPPPSSSPVATAIKRKDDTIAIMEMEIQRLKKQLANQNKAESSLQRNLDSSKAQLKAMESKVEGFQSRNKVLEDEIEHWKQVNCSLEDELADWKSQTANYKSKFEMAINSGDLNDDIIELSPDRRTSSLLSMTRKWDNVGARKTSAVPNSPMSGLWRSISSLNTSIHSTRSASTSQRDETIYNATFLQ